MKNKAKTRPVIPEADDSFLFEVYAGTRLDEIASWGWNSEEQSAFLKMQHLCQKQSYRLQYPDLVSRIILDGDDRAGYILTARKEAEMILVDIALLPQFRGKGIGLAVLTGLQEETMAADLSIQLSVFNGNPARRLYERLGFQPIEQNELYTIMKWEPHNK